MAKKNEIDKLILRAPRLSDVQFKSQVIDLMKKVFWASRSEMLVPDEQKLMWETNFHETFGFTP